jgi:hypothetical protein
MSSAMDVGKTDTSPTTTDDGICQHAVSRISFGISKVVLFLHRPRLAVPQALNHWVHSSATLPRTIQDHN